MALYNYQATDAEGKVVYGTLEARDESALVSRLQEMGYFPLNFGASKTDRVKDKDAGKALSIKLFNRGVPYRKIADFTHELSSMLEAGLPLDRSLAILADIETHPQFKELLLDIQKSVHSGRSFSDSIEKHPKVFSELYINTVRSGEANGSLDVVLSRIKKFMDDTIKLKDDITSALLYPLLLTVVGGSAIAVMVLFVIPRFSLIFDDMGSVMPLPTRALLRLSEILTAYWWILLSLMATSILSVKYFLKKEGGRVFFDSFKLKLPLTGAIFQKVAITRFARTTGSLLMGGLSILEALRIGINTMGNYSMTRNIEPVIRDVRKGKGLAASLKETGAFPPLVIHMINVGEESGRLHEMMIRLADKYDHEISTSLKRFLALLEPVIILVMALIVGFIVISLLLAVFTLNDMPI